MEKLILFLLIINLNLFGNTYEIFLNAIKNKNEKTISSLLPKIKNLNLLNENGNSPLKLATINNDVQTVNLLLNSSANINITDKEGNNLLHYAIIYNAKEVFNLLIEKGININLANKDGVTPLITASKSYTVFSENRTLTHNRDYYARFLINLGADLNFLDKEGNSALNYALHFEQDYTTVELLIKRGANVLSENFNTSPLIYAITNNMIDIFDLMIQNNLDLLKNKSFTSQYFSYLIKLNNKKILESIWDSDINLNETNIYGETPFLSACANGCLESVKFLVEKGSNIYASDFFGNNAIILGARSGNVNLLNYLINLRIDVSHRNLQGENAIMYLIKGSKEDKKISILIDNNSISLCEGTSNYSRSVNTVYTQQKFNFLWNLASNHNSSEIKETYKYIESKKNELSICRILLKNGVNIEDKDLRNWTALTLASAYGNLEIFKFLIENGANINHLDLEGFSPFQISVIFSNIEIIKLFIEKGYDINYQGKHKISPLLLINSNDENENKYNIVKLLVEKGINLNALSIYNLTPLHISAMDDSSLKMTKFLVSKGANLENRNSSSLTPLCIAILSNSLETVKYLVSVGAKTDITINNMSLLELTKDNDILKYLKQQGVK